MGTAIKHPVPDLVKPSFVIFDIRALWRSGLSVRVPGCQKSTNDVRLNPVWHRMRYSCTHMATVGVKGLMLKSCHSVTDRRTDSQDHPAIGKLLQTTSRDLMEADKERQARRTHLQRAMVDLRSRQASAMTRELLASSRPKVSAGRPPPRRATSAQTTRERRRAPVDQDDQDNAENVQPRPASADCRPCRENIEEDLERDEGPRVIVTDRPCRPFTDLVRLQRPGVTRLNRERVGSKAAQQNSVKPTSGQVTDGRDHKLPTDGET